MQLLIWLVAIFVATVVAVLAFGAALDEKNARARLLRERLASLEAAARRHPTAELELLRDELLSEIPTLNTLLARWSRSSRLQGLLAQAGVGVRPGKFLLVCSCLSASSLVILLVALNSKMLALLGAILVGALPFAYISLQRSRRFARFEGMFPEAIELLVRATRAGHPFTGALELIANEMAEPVAGEFRQVFEEQKFGLPIRDALHNLSERVPLMDVKFFVTTVLLQRDTGGNLAEILENLAYLIRERFKIRRQVRVYTAQGRLTMGLLMMLPPAVVGLIALIDAELMGLMFSDPMGHVMIAAAVTMQVIGFFLLRRIVNIKV